ncbi:uncharacterized protein AC631_04568 [Debaryomyces fabryi]|uniref:Uncharacterized protein n=1 Tax=Debaryomyces fabryi TaxID=58627 RepID=A0A0V1PTV4_9ASCO|nr:uncharacterized protein AC631_04568 [Debaryomyces fabryi]KRZ99661.1 hypothetical protein AC631_04568 [Debaryomyces fabryi]
MSLPPYEPSKDDQAYPDDIKSPTGPGDVKGSDLPAYKHEVGFLEGSDFIQREFIFCNLQWSTDVLVFPSSDAATKYKSFKNVPADSDNFRYVLDLQQNGIGMPLMEAVFSWIHSFGNGKFATIYKCLPPPPNSGRIFDKKRDRYKFCTVRKKAGTHYSQYIFSILPKPDKPSEIIEFSIFFHNKLPIADVTKYGGSNKRYRWVHSEYHRILLNFTYSLYSLDENQTSMIDNMDVSKQKLDNKNPLVYSSVGDFFKFSSKRVKEDYLSLLKFGELIHLKEKYMISSFQETAKLLLHIERSEAPLDLESANSVSIHELIIICMSYVFKRREEIRMERRRASRRHGGG